MLPSSEICDGKDNDCNGEVDDGLSTDADGDGHYTPTSCKTPHDDCNDNDATVYPGAPEICDNKDNNCDGQIDEGLDVDRDGDGYGGPGSCHETDCDDSDPNKFPGPTTDDDGDGFQTGNSCLVGDCNDNDATVYPGAPEICDGKDNNCNGLIDDVPPVSCYDGPAGTEGVGICRAGTKTCGDCEGEVLPSLEICDGLDNDCNGITDEGCANCKGNSKECCSDDVKLQSKVNMGSGKLSHSQSLYRPVRAVLPLALEVTYNSVEGDGQLGKGWTHSFNLSVSQGSDGSYIYTLANAKKLALYPSGSQYRPLDADYPVLTVNPDGTYTLMQSDSMVYNFNSSGRLTGIQDKYSNAITLAYTGDNLTGISDSQGRTISLVYNTDNRIETITDPNGNIHSFVYENNNLVNVSTLTTDLQMLTWTYSYNADGQMETKTTPMDYTITYGYDNNRLAWVIDNEDKTRTLSFEPATASSGISAGDDGQWIYVYDPATGKLATKTDPEGYTTTYTYGTNTETVTDAKGNITENVYDSAENLLSMTEKSATDPVGRTTVYTYNSDNEILTVTDPENHVTTYTYETDNGEKIVKVKDAANEETETRYYADGRIKHIKNAKGQTTTFTYRAYA